MQKGLLIECSALLAQAKAALERLIEVTDEEGTIKDGERRARYCYEVVTVAMEELRTPVDRLEMIVDKDLWPMPSYGDLIFEV